MPLLVNVEDLEFEDLIPCLRKNVHIKECNDEEQAFRSLRKLLSKLKKGHSCEHFIIGMAFASCLSEKGRVFYSVPGEKDDFVLVPISKRELTGWLDALTNNKGWKYKTSEMIW